jgi:uncharacterized BrkB/YihY/UPF0761 family membrane protein
MRARAPRKVPEPRSRTRAWGDRGRLFRTATFWLRPAFALRVVNRFQRIVGFDRAIALASSALTGLIPLAVVISAIVGGTRGRDIADWIIERYDLSGAGAQAVEGLFAPAGGTDTGMSIVGLCFLVLAVLSFTRAVQRLFEQTWELEPLRSATRSTAWSGCSAFSPTRSSPGPSTSSSATGGSTWPRRRSSCP